MHPKYHQLIKLGNSKKDCSGKKEVSTKSEAAEMERTKLDSKAAAAEEAKRILSSRLQAITSGLTNGTIA